MENKEIFDTILIGRNPSIYMSSIYIQTYNMKQLVIKEESEESLDFYGHEMVSGVLDVVSKEDLVDKLEKQAQNLGAMVVEEEVESISFDTVFRVKCKKQTFLTKTVVVDSKTLEINKEGCFYSLGNIKTKEAIEMMANGCKISFAVREYVNKLNP